jgi:hypothetical protein
MIAIGHRVRLEVYISMMRRMPGIDNEEIAHLASSTNKLSRALYTRQLGTTMHSSLLFLAIVAGVSFASAAFRSERSTTNHRASPSLYTRQSSAPREIHYFDQPV